MVRDNKWDFYKAFLIYCVILGHIITALKSGDNSLIRLHLFIRTFDMPMFALISGYFLRKSCNRNQLHINVLNKICGILLPIIIWTWIYNFLGGHIDLSIGRFWFLWSIFFTSLIVILIDYVYKKIHISRAILFVCSILFFHTLIIDKWNIGFLLFPCIIGYYYNEIVKCYTKIFGGGAYILNYCIRHFCDLQFVLERRL